jgi:uncharacterized membrane protein YeaQ/YmgE (transglycosylase-associated protein family)
MESEREGDVHRGREDRKLNLVQLVVLGWILGLVAVTAARFAGFGWGMSILIGWAGMVLGTLAVSAIFVLLESLQSRLRRRLQHGGSFDQVEALIDAWDKDLVLDRARARAEMTDLSHGFARHRETTGG